MNYHDIMKSARNNGRCVHVENLGCSGKIISAHSIQRGGQLKIIAENGKVYQYEKSYTEKNIGKYLPPKLIGIKNVSTFFGFCSKHDNDVFKDIDTLIFDQKNKKQVCLYSYRSIAKEKFTKENAIDSAYKIMITRGYEPDILAFYLAAKKSLEIINKKMNELYEMIIKDDYDRLQYYSFNSNSNQNFSLSGIEYPNFDAFGNQIQDPLSMEKELILNFTAPTENGWSHCLCWVRPYESYNPCKIFAESITKLKNIAGGLLLYSIISCENHAFRISWYDNLNEREKFILNFLFDQMIRPNCSLDDNFDIFNLWGIDSIYKAIA